MEGCGLLLSVVKLGVFCEWMGWTTVPRNPQLGIYCLLGMIAELMHKDNHDMQSIDALIYLVLALVVMDEE